MGAKCSGGLNEMTVAAGAKGGSQHSILLSAKGQWGEEELSCTLMVKKHLTQCQSSRSPFASFKTRTELFCCLWWKRSWIPLNPHIFSRPTSLVPLKTHILCITSVSLVIIDPRWFQILIKEHKSDRWCVLIALSTQRLKWSPLVTMLHQMF